MVDFKYQYTNKGIAKTWNKNTDIEINPAAACPPVMSRNCPPSGPLEKNNNGHKIPSKVKSDGQV